MTAIQRLTCCCAVRRSLPGASPLQDYQLLDQDSVRRAVAHSDIVVNLVGQDYDSRHFSLEDANITGARNIAAAAAEVGAERLIHVSCLNAELDHESRFLSTKAEGELAVIDEFPVSRLPFDTAQACHPLMVVSGMATIPPGKFSLKACAKSRIVRMCTPSRRSAGISELNPPLPSSPFPGRGLRLFRLAWRRGCHQNATIIRPANIFGGEDRFANKFASMAKLPFGQPVMDGGSQLKTPVYVSVIRSLPCVAENHRRSTWVLTAVAARCLLMASRATSLAELLLPQQQRMLPGPLTSLSGEFPA